MKNKSKLMENGYFILVLGLIGVISDGLILLPCYFFW